MLGNYTHMMAYKRRQELMNGISMLPGIVMSYLFFKTTPYPQSIAMIGYTITCCCSMICHFGHAYYCNFEQKWLRTDLIGQHVGLMFGISQSILRPSSVLLLLPASLLGIITDLDDPSERNLAYLASAINILTTVVFSPKLVIQWLIAFCFFGAERFINTNGMSHLLWHAMCHIVIYQFFGHVHSQAYT